jgi:hypothetical protein
MLGRGRHLLQILCDWSLPMHRTDKWNPNLLGCEIRKVQPTKLQGDIYQTHGEQLNTFLMIFILKKGKMP